MNTGSVFPPPQRLTPRQQERIRSILQDEMLADMTPVRSRPASRRARVRIAAITATAVVAAVTVALAVTVPSSRLDGRTPAHHPAAVVPTGSKILLAAATNVARQQPGRYWHINIYEGETNIPGGVSDTDDQWTARDGNDWSSPPCKAGLSGEIVMKNGGVSFGLGNPRKPTPSWSYDLVQHWPTSPAALEARIATYSTNKSEELEALIALELVVPAPPGVRAAAYRAIATFPGVQDRGAVKGGQAVFIPARDGGPLLLVLDPATGLIRSETWPEATGQGSWNVLLAQWTNQLPKVVPLNKYYCSGGG
jgi:hypothetical protein